MPKKTNSGYALFCILKNTIYLLIFTSCFLSMLALNLLKIKLIYKEAQLVKQKNILNDKYGKNNCIDPELYSKDILIRYNALYNSSFYCIYIHDLEGNFIDANNATLKLFGYTLEELKKINLTSFFPKEYINSSFSLIEFITNNYINKNLLELRLKNKNGEFIWVESEALILYKEGSPYAIQWIARDITHKKNMIDQLHMLSLIDDLTGLYNRRGFINLAEQHLRLAKRLQKEILIIFADVDNLKFINDNFGHKEGDKVIISTASILKKTFRESDILARIGGDEFVVLTIDTTYGTSEAIIKRLHENFEQYNKVYRHNYHLSVSTGISIYSSNSVYSVYDLLDSADKMMYHHKRKRNHRSIIFNCERKRLLSEAVT